MKLFGLELELHPVDMDSADAALDIIHDAMTSDPAIYSVDLVLDDEAAYMLAGVKVDDDSDMDDAVEFFRAAFEKAMIAADADHWGVQVAQDAREMAFA
ncbi:hypothetical protein [Isoptericola sp. NPDC057653]|uniref:hypothetical protein n=1 Tax=Isoptericola sp. NPDC057653 TaxID=3346195 RepID=UPI0036941A7D